MNTLNKQTICIKKLDAFLIEETINLKKETELQTGFTQEENYALALSFNAEMMNLGFIMSEELLNKVKDLKKETITTIAINTIPILRDLKGAHVIHSSMYPNFPSQVMDASIAELYFNALTHYWTSGQWTPDYQLIPRDFEFETHKFREIGLATPSELTKVFTQLLSSNDSLSNEDKLIIEWFMLNYDSNQLCIPENIPFAENKCVISAILLAQSKDITPLIKSATDLLRIVTYLSDGDVSLAENTKFISLPRSLRKILTLQLEKVINEEDIGRHRNKWVRLFHSLHVGEYSEKVYSIAKKARNNQSLESFYSRVEYYLNTKSVVPAVNLLKKRPGEFARKVDHLIRLSETKQKNRLQRIMKLSPETLFIVENFLMVADQVPTRTLLQLLGHLNQRQSNLQKRVVFPKGNSQKAITVKKALPAIKEETHNALSKGITNILISRFSNQASLGKVWIDPDLKNCPVPSQQRSASTGLFNVARGTQLPTGDDNTLRFFVYWVGRDIDLGASFHDESFKLIEHISYTNLRSTGYQACHSGDITYAPNGASEFIDVTIDGAIQRGARYIAMNVMVYSGPNFSEHETCFAGWMTRSYPNSNEVFDAKTVEQKVDIRANTKNVLPVIFDLVTRKAIWVDITTSRSIRHGGNNIESNKATIEEKMEAIVNSKHKATLYDLFKMHAQARGELVEDPKEANQIFSIRSGITPYHINDINSDYIE